MKGLKIFAANLIDGLLSVITLGIYAIFQLVNTARAKETFGMRVLGISYSNADRSGNLMIMNQLVYILWMLSFGILMIIDVVFLLSGKESFGEKWSGNTREA